MQPGDGRSACGSVFGPASFGLPPSDNEERITFGGYEAEAEQQEVEENCTDTEADWLDAQEAELQAELEEDLRQLRCVEAKLEALGHVDGMSRPCQTLSSPIHWSVGASEVLTLESLPLECIIFFLAPAGLAAVLSVGTSLGHVVARILHCIAEDKRAQGQPPFLLSLLHFLHCTHTPRLAWQTLGDPVCYGHVPRVPDFEAGRAVRVMPQASTRGLLVECTGDRLSEAQRQRFYTNAYSCSWSLGGHMTPNVVQLQVFCPQQSPDPSLPNLEVGFSLVDTAVPNEPLFTLQWSLPDTPHAPMEERAFVREAVRCQGAAGAWAYRQRPWQLGRIGATHDARPAVDSRMLMDPVVERPSDGCRGKWLRLHFEFDWQAARCVAFKDESVQDILDLAVAEDGAGSCCDVEFGGTAPTVDQLRLQLAPGVALCLHHMLIG